MNMKIFTGGVIALLAVVGLVWIVADKDGESEESDGAETITEESAEVPEPGSGVFELELADLDGRNVKLEEFMGKPLVINAWTTWCPFCLEELQAFAEVKEEFGDQIEIIAIDRAESAKTAGAFIEKSGIGDNLVWLLDRGDSFYQVIGGFSMPETLFIRADGTTSFHKRGPMTVSEIRERVEDMLI